MHSLKMMGLVALATGASIAYAEPQNIQLEPGSSTTITVQLPTSVTCLGKSEGESKLRCSVKYSGFGGSYYIYQEGKSISEGYQTMAGAIAGIKQLIEVGACSKAN